MLSRGEVERLLAVMEGTHALMARLLYGTGMRLMECVRLRVKDVDFERGELTVRHGKGGKDRLTVLPASVVPALQAHLARVRVLWERAEAAGHRYAGGAGTKVSFCPQVLGLVLGFSGA